MNPIPPSTATAPESDVPITDNAPEGNGSLEVHEALDDLIAEIAKLQETRVQELHTYRDWLHGELVLVEGEMAELAESDGAAPSAEEVVRRNGHAKEAAGLAKGISLKKLVAELEAAPEHTLNIRKAKLDVRQVKTLVRENPHLLQVGGKGAWPTVTLLEQPEPELEDPAQAVFAFD